MQWLWTIFSSFYLIAYAFWIPVLFENILVMIPILITTLVIGGGLLVEGVGEYSNLRKITLLKCPYYHN